MAGQEAVSGTTSFYSPWRKEKKCWELLVSIMIFYKSPKNERLPCRRISSKKLYREGASFISILDPEVLKEAEKWRNLSFLERKDMFVDLFRSFKARVDKVMRGPCLEECVLIIGKLSKQSATNRVNNDNKQYDLKEGRKRSDRKTGKAKKKG
jgi:hypothetical protein